MASEAALGFDEGLSGGLFEERWRLAGWPGGLRPPDGDREDTGGNGGETPPSQPARTPALRENIRTER